MNRGEECTPRAVRQSCEEICPNILCSRPHTLGLVLPCLLSWLMLLFSEIFSIFSWQSWALFIIYIFHSQNYVIIARSNRNSAGSVIFWSEIIYLYQLSSIHVASVKLSLESNKEIIPNISISFLFEDFLPLTTYSTHRVCNCKTVQSYKPVSTLLVLSTPSDLADIREVSKVKICNLKDRRREVTEKNLRLIKCSGNAWNSISVCTERKGTQTKQI